MDKPIPPRARIYREGDEGGDDCNNMPFVDLSHTVVLKCGETVYGEIERKMRLVIKPRPLWLPKRIWKWLLNQFLVIQEFKK